MDLSYLVYDLFMLVLPDVGVMIFKWYSLIVMACLGIHLKLNSFIMITCPDMHFKLNSFTMMACLDMHMGGLYVGNSRVVVCLDTGMLARLGCIGTDMCMACGLLCGQSMT